ncbi:hypothetical protein ACFFRB_08370 [Kibdelosporangium aridum subsp. largum]
MMVDYLGEQPTGDRIRGAVRQALRSGSVQLNSDGTATSGTKSVTTAVIGALA